MQAEIYDRFSHLNDSDAGRAAIDEYVANIASGSDHLTAEVRASNVLQRAGFDVNSHGGASFRVASIEDNADPGVRVALMIDRDDRGHFIATSNDDDTEARFATPAEAYAAILVLWGAQAWSLRLAGE